MKKWVNDHLSRASCVLICFSYIESIISGYLQNNPRRWELLFPFFREREQTQIDETITKVHTANKHWSSGLSPTSKCKGRATVPCWTLIWLSSVSLCLSPLSWSPCHGNCLASWSVYNWCPILPLPVTLLKSWNPIAEHCLVVSPTPPRL